MDAHGAIRGAMRQDADNAVARPARTPRTLASVIGVPLVPGAPLSPGDVSVLCTLAGISAAVLVAYLARGTIRKLLPSWLRPFAPEQGPDRPAKRRGWTHWTLGLGLVSLAGLVLAVVPACLGRRQPIAALDTAPWLVAVIITVIDRPTKTPRFLLLHYLLILCAALAMPSARFLDHSIDALDPYRAARAALAALAILAIINMPLRDPAWETEDIGNPNLAPTQHARSPEDNLTLVRFWTMSWVFPLARICRHKEITVDDVWQLPLEFQHARLYAAFGELRGRLMPRLAIANGLDLAVATVLAIVERVADVSNTRLTAKLYGALDRQRPDEAYFWCLVMLAVDLMRQLCAITSSWYSRKAYERSRGETFIALFSKLLTRAVAGSDATERGAPDAAADAAGSRGRKKKNGGGGSRRKKKGQEPDPGGQPASNAKVVNLVRGDTYDISQLFWEFPKLVSQPVKIAFAAYYLVDIMGWPSSVGFALVALFVLANSLLVRELIRTERQRATCSDKRAQAVSHFVEASRPLKLNGWTASWSGRTLRFRAAEMLQRLRVARIAAAISTTNVAGATAYPLASICIYTLVLRQGLPNAVIWPSLQLFAQLEGSVKEAFALTSGFFKAAIPVDRVNRFMEEPDRDEPGPGSARAADIEFRDASFSWPQAGPAALEGLRLRFSPGLTVVRGKVGSGKSSLLLAALNEMELCAGEVVRPDEPFGYAQQLPWLQSRTIRDNILFHHRLDPARYRQALNACALNPDLAVLPDGDLTRLDEGGVGLSGGQRARVALARAIYSPCRVLLLDDPLAALDHDTASAVVRRFLRGPLARGRIIVMVTHRDDLVLPVADQVVDMVDGRATVLSPEQLRLELEHPIHAPRGGGGGGGGGDGDDDDKHNDDDDEQHSEASEEQALVGRESPEETSETGGVSLSVYVDYARAGGWHMWLFLAFFYGMSRYADIARARLLEAWGNNTALRPSFGVGGGGSGRYWGLPDPESRPQVWLGILAALSVVQIVTHAVAQLLLAEISVQAAKGIFARAIERLGRATFRYHDVTPTGQLKNRLIADMGVVDGGILSPLEMFLYSLVALVMSLVAIAVHQPFLLVFLGATGLLFVHYFRYYVPVSRCLRRMEMRYLTPIIANIGVMQDGLVTIRALRAQGRFRDRHLEAVDDFQKQDHFFWSMAFWLSFRLGTASAVARALIVLFMTWSGTAASAIGFVLTQTTTAMAAVQVLCEKVAQLQLDGVALERVGMLRRIPAEPSGGDEPPEDWPRPGDAVRFDKVSFRYADGLPAVLDRVSFEIPGGATCAILGRTGSGKSTIANALLATQLPSEGSVSIGGLDLASLDRTALRRRLTFIQQDPVLFPGTLRDNLDPEGSFDDAACLQALHRVLGPAWALDSPIDAGGKNLSQGQRQLVGIGRAVLRRSRLVILDEATASIDRPTAALVQRILREELAESTVITIAHRLEAVEDADWCLRLDRGRVVECGPAKGMAARRHEHKDVDGSDAAAGEEG